LLQNRAALLTAQEMLSLQSQNKTIDIVLRARICTMVRVLNIFLDRTLQFMWRNASMVVAKAQGHGSTCARSICKWILDFVQEGTLPLHFYCGQQTILEDEGILQEIQEQLTKKAKSSFIKAQDVCKIVASARVQMKLT
jgi:hypothetical protein